MKYTQYLKEMVDLSDPIPSDEDKLRSNSEILDIYGRGKGFNVYDNNSLLRVIKIVKDFTDFHRIIYSMSYDINMEGKEVRFQIRSNYHERDKAHIMFLFESIVYSIMTAINSAFDDVCMEQNFEDDDEYLIVNLKVRDPTREDDRKEIDNIFKNV